MKMPAFLSSYVEGNSPKRLFQGLAVGVIATMVIGFSWGGWVLGSTAAEKAEMAAQTAMVQALAPICAARFEEAANAENGMVAEFAEVNSWQRDSHLMKAGWATFPGGAKPDNDVAEACAKLLITSLKIK
ncbi:MAG: hypothetical protein J4F33_09735 [Alphaproteobacteria bacterium]|nr:hypothetical protein [Alphaproteobacteria bacterium]